MYVCMAGLYPAQNGGIAADQGVVQPGGSAAAISRVYV